MELDPITIQKITLASTASRTLSAAHDMLLMQMAQLGHQQISSLKLETQLKDLHNNTTEIPHSAPEVP
jgi:hypothetical protein